MSWIFQEIAVPNFPLQVFYDGACPLCSREVRFYRRRDALNRIEWIDIAAKNFHAETFGLDPTRVQQVMHARTPDGKIHTQVAAFVQIWKALPRTLFTTPLLWLFKIPGTLPLANFFYRAFARNRHRLTGRCDAQSCGASSGSPLK